MKPGQMHRSSLVVGVVPLAQMRRGFLYYLERERAHPTRAMVHYNSWYDLATGRTISPTEAFSTVDALGRELAARNVSLDAVLLDDGWDDPDNGKSAAHCITEAKVSRCHNGPPPQS